MISTASAAIAAASLAAILFSLNGLIVRSLQAMDYWQIAGYRAVGIIVGGAALLAFRQRRRFSIRLNWAILIGSFLNTLASVAYIFGVLNTTVANVSIVLSTTPLLASLVAMAFIGESINAVLLLFSAAASIGITVMSVSAARSAEIAGLTGAAVNVFAFVCLLCLVRSRPNLDMFISISGGALLTAMFGFILSRAQTPPFGEILVCLVWGAVSQTTAYALIIFASKTATTAEVTNVLLIEYLLAPFWVFFTYGERPSTLALIGGTITLCSVAAGVIVINRTRRLPIKNR